MQLKQWGFRVDGLGFGGLGFEGLGLRGLGFRVWGKQGLKTIEGLRFSGAQTVVWSGSGAICSSIFCRSRCIEKTSS